MHEIKSPILKTAFVAWTNTDLTEGRGHVIPLVICYKETTARRLGRKGDVQGCDCPVTKVEIFSYKGLDYGPVHIKLSTREDDIEQDKLDKKAAAKEKAKKLGLTDNEIEALAS